MGLTFLSNPDEKKIGKSFQYFEDAEKKGYDGYKVMSAKALGEYKLSDYKKAKKTFEQLTSKYKNSFTIDDLLIEAKTLIALNELKEAAENLKMIVTRNNQFINTSVYNFLQGLISLKKACSMGMGKDAIASELQRAKSNFEEATRIDITYPDSYLGLSITDFHLGLENSSMAHLDKSFSLGIQIERYENDSKFSDYFKSKSVKKKIKAYEKQK